MNASVILFLVCFLSSAGWAGGQISSHIIGWGSNAYFRFEGYSLSQSITGVVSDFGKHEGQIKAITGGVGLALFEDGRVVNCLRIFPELSRPPKDLANVVSVASGRTYSLALKSNGTIVDWGSLSEKKIAPPGLSNVLAIAVGSDYGLALCSGGNVLGWGRTTTPPGLSNIIAISASGHNLAIKADGTVVEWDLRYKLALPVPGLSNVVAVAAGANHQLALKSDGTVFGWGDNSHGEATGRPTKDMSRRSEGIVTIGGVVLSNVVAIAANGTITPASGYSLALKSDGTVVAWGKGLSGEANVPFGLSNVVAIAAGDGYCLAVTTNAAVAERFRH